MTRQRFVDRQSARAACAVPVTGTHPVRPVGRDPFPLSSCPARRADRGGHPREVPVHRPRAARSACAAHTRSSSFTHPILSEVARSTHQQSTPRGQLHLGFQREPAVTSPVRIKSQSYWFESNRGSRAPAQRPVGLLSCDKVSRGRITYSSSSTVRRGADELAERRRPRSAGAAEGERGGKTGEQGRRPA